jgi:hypothetical protein
MWLKWSSRRWADVTTVLTFACRLSGTPRIVSSPQVGACGVHHLRRRVGIRGLALFALAMQLIFSFSHVHTVALDQGRVPLACRTFFPQVAEQQCPRPPEEDRGCAICWTATQAGSLVLPTASKLIVPVSVGIPKSLECGTEFARVSRTAVFNARGPPSGHPG